MGTAHSKRRQHEILVRAIEKKRWEKVMTILKSNNDHDDGNNNNKEEGKLILIDAEGEENAASAFSGNTCTILWAEAPWEVIHQLLRIWPEVRLGKNFEYDDLVCSKMKQGEWDFIRTFLQEFPNLILNYQIEKAVDAEKLPADVFERMLHVHPEFGTSGIAVQLSLIRKGNSDCLRTLLQKHPDATIAKDPNLKLPLLLAMFERKSYIDADCIRVILNANPDTAKDKDADGKHPLHLAHQYGISKNIIDMLFNAYPEADTVRDNLGRTPSQLANHVKKPLFAPSNEVLILNDDNSTSENKIDDTKKYPGEAVSVCRGDMLMRDLSLEQKRDTTFNTIFVEQLVARRTIFDTLLGEFSKLVGIDDKDAIQKSAALQTLAVRYLSHGEETIIDYTNFDNPGYWYQQEILKLVMRVYNEGQTPLFLAVPSIENDAYECLDNLEDDSSTTAPEPSASRVKVFEQLLGWLTEGFDERIYSFEGPALKPLQSLFNKIFIRRGQTNVHIIGDIVRATLYVHDESTLQDLVEKIHMTFPNIVGKSFQQPDEFPTMVDFFHFVYTHLKHLHDTDILPYRFKVNSSQKERTKDGYDPLWYNFNFFHDIPEYHSVGNSQMIVAYELQIGVTSEIKRHRKTHIAYERDRILSSQTLLKNYIVNDAMKNNNTSNITTSSTTMSAGDKMQQEKVSTTTSKQVVVSSSNCSPDDVKIIDDILMGRIAKEVLLPSAKELVWEEGPVSFSDDSSSSYIRPERKCLNNRSLNWFASTEGAERRKLAHVLMTTAGGGGNSNHNNKGVNKGNNVMSLDESKRYFVDSMSLTGILEDRYHIGLYAHFGEYYMTQVACKAKDKGFDNLLANDDNDQYHYEYDENDDDEKNGTIFVVKSGCNFSCMEQLCPLPPRTRAVEVIIYGAKREYYTGYKKLSIVLKEFDVLT